MRSLKPRTTTRTAMYNYGGSGLPNITGSALPVGVLYNFYIYGSIGPVIDYADMIAALDHATEADVFRVHINTPGGDLDSALAIIHAFMRTRAHVVTIADGEVASAGTIIFFAGHSFVINRYANFMFHDGSTGSFQKVNEQLKRLNALSELLQQLAHDLYSPWLDDEEIDSILSGRDEYKTSAWVLERVTDPVRIRAHVEKQKAMIEEANAINDRMEQQIEDITAELEAEAQESKTRSFQLNG